MFSSLTSAVKNQCVLDRNLVRNGFRTIRSHAFNGTKLNTL